MPVKARASIIRKPRGGARLTTSWGVIVLSRFLATPGSDVQAVIKALEAVKDKETPQLLHIITRKGKGYGPAEDDAIKYHGVPAFALEPALTEKAEPVTAPAKPKAKTYSDIFTQALIDTAAVEPDVVAITPATAEGSGLVKFSRFIPSASLT